MTSLVVVGNATQPFARLLDAVTAIADSLPQPVIVQHGNTPFSNPNCRAFAFIARDKFSEMLSNSRVVICHAGAGSVIEALRTGHVPVVMPRRRKYGEHIDDHQVEFANMLRESEKAVVVEAAGELFMAVTRALATPMSSRATEPLLISMVRESLRAGN